MRRPHPFVNEGQEHERRYAEAKEHLSEVVQPRVRHLLDHHLVTAEQKRGQVHEQNPFDEWRDPERRPFLVPLLGLHRLKVDAGVHGGPREPSRLRLGIRQLVHRFGELGEHVVVLVRVRLRQTQGAGVKRQIHIRHPGAHRAHPRLRRHQPLGLSDLPRSERRGLPPVTDEPPARPRLEPVAFLGGPARGEHLE